MEIITSQPLTNASKFPNNTIIFSHLRWDFVYQRPQHLASRIAEISELYFIEEPIFDANGSIFYEKVRKDNVTVVIPHLKPGLGHQFTIDGLNLLFTEFIDDFDLDNSAFWYYTPMALEFSTKYQPAITIYDCMDELSAFKFAPDNIQLLEKDLFKKADLVFTGGNSLYQAKKTCHENIYAFPSSIDKSHFSSARNSFSNPADQVITTSPKLGFYGVIDERFDVELIDTIAKLKPDWQIILIGPIVKIDPHVLPSHPNIHYLGAKTYNELPSYMGLWDIALIPFLLNESTKFISPTKTPEYLAAGLPVISTPIIDVVDPYGVNNLVGIGADADDFIRIAEKILNSRDGEIERLIEVDNFLKLNSWDLTFGGMKDRIFKVLDKKKITLLQQQYV